MTKFYSVLIFLMILGCGSGKFTINEKAGERSEVTVDSLSNRVPSSIGKSFFEDNLFEVTVTNCATSGCHLVNDAFLNETIFFQIDPDDFEASWLWISSRRNEVLENSYTSTASDTLQGQKDIDHNTFTEWATDEKQLLDQWTELTE